MPNSVAKIVDARVRNQAITAFDEVSNVQRIPRVTITPQPNTVLLDFTTKLPTIPIVEIFHLEISAKGELLFRPDNVAGLAFDFITGTTFTNHHARIPNLDQNTNYSFRITAPNAEQPPAVTTGRFKTGTRSCQVTINEIILFNDGDPGGDGELSWEFGLYKDGDRVGHAEFALNTRPDVIKLPFAGPAFQLNFAPDRLTIYVHGTEDDTFWGRFTGEAPFRLPEGLPTHSEDDDGVDTQVAEEIQLPNEDGPHPIHFNLDSGPWGIHYIIGGRMDVNVKNPARTIIRDFGDRNVKVYTPVKIVGALTSIKPQPGRMHTFGLGPDGLIVHRQPRDPRTGVRQWKPIPTHGADVVSIFGQSENIATIIALKDGVGRMLHYELTEQSRNTSHSWIKIGEDFRGAFTTIPDSDGRMLVMGQGKSGQVRLAKVDAATDSDIQWHDLGGNFVGQVSAIATDEIIDLFGVTENGDVMTRSWRMSSHPTGEWHSLKAKNATHVAAFKDESGKHVVILTRDRLLLAISDQGSDFSKPWRSVGTLDNATSDDPLEPTNEVSPDNTDDRLKAAMTEVAV
jgi:hypothetical protein